MIDVRSVVLMKIPFPDLNSNLALSRHMYICFEKSGNKRKFLKCQTYKPLIHSSPTNPPNHYVVERSNPTRNPFEKPATLIDLDKYFITSGVRFNRNCLTSNRPDICGELFNVLQEEISGESMQQEILDSNMLIRLNPSVTLMQ